MFEEAYLNLYVNIYISLFKNVTQFLYYVIGFYCM
jgi:hypothetical protein